MLTDNRTGGETGFNPDKDKFTTNHYGLGIETKRYEGFAKIGYVFPEKNIKVLACNYLFLIISRILILE